MQSGTVEAIFLASSPGSSPQRVPEVSAVAGKGLEGDRYFAGSGTFFEERKEGQDLTLIESEALGALAAESGIELGPGESRRNVVTRGITLNDLVGRRFSVGEITCVGRRLCDPCRHLERATQPGVLKGLADRGGLRADIVTDGRIAVGDAVRELGLARGPAARQRPGRGSDRVSTTSKSLPRTRPRLSRARSFHLREGAPLMNHDSPWSATIIP